MILGFQVVNNVVSKLPSTKIKDNVAPKEKPHQCKESVNVRIYRVQSLLADLGRHPDELELEFLFLLHGFLESLFSLRGRHN